MAFFAGRKVMSKVNYLAAALLLSFLQLTLCSPLMAAEEFDLSLLEKSGKISKSEADVFNRDSDILPGSYLMTIIINQHEMAHKEVTFQLNHGRSEPLFGCRELQEWGMQIETCPRERDFLADWVAGARFDVDMSENQLLITVPQQAWRLPNPYDIAPNWKWDNGINAAFINYDLYAQRNEYQSSRSSNLYGNLTNGINIAGLRFRNSGFITAPEMSSPRYQSSTSWLAYDIDSLRSTLTVGDFYTNGSLFAGTSLRGVGIATNMAMFPSTERSYVPAIIGSVSANATVIIKQNGYAIATRQIPPGAFNLNDIPVSSSAGDIDVTIIEANGRRQHFIQPFNNSSFQLPAKSLRYTFNAGRSRQYDKQQLMEATFMYGLNNTFTLLEGAQYAPDYQNFASGLGANLRWLGGLNLLFNHSQAKRNARRLAGSQLQLGLSRFLPLTDSYIYASVTHRFTPDYRDFNTTTQDDRPTYGNYRDKYSVQLNQSIKGVNMALNYSQEMRWNGQSNRSWQASLNFHPGRATLLTSFSRRYRANSAGENYVSMSLSIPLGRERKYYLDISQTGGVSHSSQIAFSGNAGADDALNYSLGVSRSARQYQYDASARYNSSFGVTRATWSHSSAAQQWQLGQRGSVVVHHHGVTLGQYLNESAAIIHTSHIRSIGVENAQYVKTDRWGNAVVPGLVPYYYNELTPILNRKNHHTVKIDGTVQRRVPRQGAIVEVEFSASRQQQHYVRARQADGAPLAFGSILYDAENRNRGIVSAGGIASIDIYRLIWPLHSKLSSGETCHIARPDEQALQQQIWTLICR
ncbi:fimbrial biogenesis outer membrane usher protein [Mixta tenebrionis]|uniref:Fimbrial biogenesis outer membrane usher protein n=2 Tax=Mixta tenebrionis TaxID=2562439 RepID=A0A506VAG5_9GAMM|nr:fimbrial biogenesis outer membrane usher protein [Mixta tenebrionis]